MYHPVQHKQKYSKNSIEGEVVRSVYILNFACHFQHRCYCYIPCKCDFLIYRIGDLNFQELRTEFLRANNMCNNLIQQEEDRLSLRQSDWNGVQQ